MLVNNGVKTAIVVEGGAMRGIFSCGILDEFIANDFYPFDLCLGVSAGASNLAVYLAKMHGRNLKIYLDYSLRPEFIRYGRFLAGGHLMDLDWMWNITRDDLPIDTDTLLAQHSRFLATVTCAETGAPDYLTPTADELFDLLKASSALPIFYRDTVSLRGRQWSDGGVADAIPVQEAYRLGARRILVIRSRPFAYQKKPSREDALLPWILGKSPGLVPAMMSRPARYQQSLDFIRNPPADAEFIEICLPENFPVSRMTSDRRLLQQGYQVGRDTAQRIFDLWAT